MRSSPFAPATRALRTTLAALVLAGVACRADGPTAGGGAGARIATVSIRAVLAGSDVRALTILVSGPGIASPIVANVDVPADVPVATTTLEVPVGDQRTLVARGYDAGGALTHEGLTTVAVRPGANASVAIRLYARTGDVPIGVGIGAYDVRITPAPLPALVVDDTRQLAAAVRDDDGAPVPGAVATWGTLDPGVATVSRTGLVTARAEGLATLYATYRGSAASVEVAVVALPASSSTSVVVRAP